MNRILDPSNIIFYTFGYMMFEIYYILEREEFDYKLEKTYYIWIFNIVKKIKEKISHQI